jgi:hypothetical protein
MSEEGKPVIVKDNIKNIEDGITNFKQQIVDLKRSIETTKEEILRLEGCLIVFKGFEKAGISKIVPDNFREPVTPTFPEVEKTEPKCNEPQLPPRPAFLDQQSNKLFQHIPHTH